MNLRQLEKILGNTSLSIVSSLDGKWLGNNDGVEFIGNTYSEALAKCYNIVATTKITHIINDVYFYAGLPIYLNYNGSSGYIDLCINNQVRFYIPDSNYARGMRCEMLDWSLKEID